jgi:hypothetical protein
MKRIVVDPPVSEARRDRVERQLFAQLAAVRVADRAEAVIPRPKRRRGGLAFAFAGLAAAALAVVLVTTRESGPVGATAAPSRVVTPLGGESRFTIGREAIIDAKSDTSVEWQQAGDGAITLMLERGAVDCQVEPRGNRPPFRVVAGDVMVVVVGTRFTVTRTPTSRVDVAHGKVRVEAPGGTWMVEAGESWTPVSQVASAPVPLPVPVSVPLPLPDPDIAMEPVKVPRAKKPSAVTVRAPSAVEPPTSRELAKDAYRVALKLEANEPERAAAMYRAIAISEKSGGFAASALISLAELQIYKLKDAEGALAAIEDHQQRFPHAPTREEASWLRIEALRVMGKRDEARGAAADYLREFPKGVYADRLSNDLRK